MVFVFLFLTSLSMRISSCSHVAANGIILFFFYFIVYMYHIFLIQSSVIGELGCFHVSAIVNSATMNIGVNVYLFKWMFCPDICPGLGLLDRMVECDFAKCYLWRKLGNMYKGSLCIISCDACESTVTAIKNKIFFECTHDMWMFPGQGMNLHHSSDLSHSNDNTGCLACWAMEECPKFLMYEAWTSTFSSVLSITKWNKSLLRVPLLLSSSIVLLGRWSLIKSLSSFSRNHSP